MAMECQARRQMGPKYTHLLDLDQNLIISICRLLSVQDKLQLWLVNTTFLKLLDEPAPGCGVWGVVDLHELNFDQKLDWLYRHAYHCSSQKVT